MNYTLGGNNLWLTYKVQVMKSYGNLDFCKRKVIPVFSYFDKNGEEAYTDTENIKFESREITLECFYRNTSANFISGWNTFLTFIKGTGTKTLVTPYGSHTVFCNSAIDVTEPTKRSQPIRYYLFKLKFTEPTPNDIATTPSLTAGTTKWGIDAYDLKDNFGIYVGEITGVYSLPERKQYPIVNDIWENGDVFRTGSSNIHFESRDIRIKGYFKADTDAEMVTNINAFKWLLFKAGKRTLNVPNDATVYRVVSLAGGTVNRLSLGFSEFSIPLRLINNTADPT